MRPEISLVVCGHDQAATIEASVASAFEQACEPIEIILSDDCSSDDTHARMLRLAEAYRGPHDVVVRRNATNLGIAPHLDAVMAEARGALLVVLAGDDIALPTRVEHVAHAWRESGRRLDLIASHVIDMSLDGQDLGVLRVDDLQDWPDVSAWARGRPYIIGAAHAITRRLYERFGPVVRPIVQEDQVNVLRALCSGGAHTIDRALVRYRRGGISSSRFMPATFRAYATRRNRRHMAVIDQWLHDAETAGCRNIVEKATQWTHSRERFMEELLDAGSLLRELKLVLSRTDIDLQWRWRRFVDLRAPRAALLGRRLRDVTRS